MDHRKKALQQIRPELKLDNSQAGSMEGFQNEVLRPILKFQNVVLVSMLKEWMNAHKQPLDQMSKEKASELIDHVIKTNKALKAQFLGVILAMMTLEELDFFYVHKREFQKRISTMLIKRIQDQIL
ncbi:MAG: hypothetical protein MRZ79_08385 [Bacteroidia bacterium]|nr:hypothetical protein [Bacteroidia bacterium]